MPRPVEGVDMRRLPIGPEEAFVLSRVDGRSSEADIAAATGLDGPRVRESLERLLELGAISMDLPPGSVPPPPPRSHEQAHPQHLLEHPVIEAPSERHAQPQAAAALYDPAELDEDVDLDLPRKRRILDLFYRLDNVNHYELLEVPEDADKKAIKGAYYAVVTLFHPDRYFGKNVGNFKPKLEKIFARLTEAHDVLTRKRSRQEYDQYLATQNRNQALEQMMNDEASQQRELEQVRRSIEDQARMAERVSHSVPPPSSQDRPQPSARSYSPAGTVPPRSDPEARRRALARKLGRGSLRPSEASVPPASTPPSTAAKQALKDELRRRYEQRVVGLKGDQIQRYVEAAEQSLKDDNPVSAANALRIAVSLDPSDQDLAARFEAVQTRANAELSQNYLEQAQYEERAGRYADAAQSYERAARGKANARLLERAAFCLLEAAGDLRKAGELAREAVGMAPEQAGPRTTLARIYLAANMKQSALAEFERAAQLAPGDETLKNLIKRAKRGEA